MDKEDFKSVLESLSEKSIIGELARDNILFAMTSLSPPQQLDAALAVKKFKSEESCFINIHLDRLESTMASRDSL